MRDATRHANERMWDFFEPELRRLSEEGGTFQTVLKDTRKDLARHYLTTSALSAPEIAFLLGYEDPNSFYRAFRSWTGQTPEGARLAAS